MPRNRDNRKSRDDLARERLAPLAEGERPRAVTVAAVIALLVAMGNLIAYAAGTREIGNTEITLAGILPMSILLLVAAIGMWYSRYWAVLGFQAFLALTIITLALSLVSRNDVLALLLVGGFLLACGVLFWFLVKGMARLQMPEPPSARRKSQER